MSEIEYISDHVDQQLALLITQIKDQPNWRDMITILTKFSQELEDVYRDIRNKFDLDVAEGDQLDILGRMAGILRTSTNDDAFREDVKFKILQNRSAGELYFIYNVIEFLTNATSIWIKEFYPASMSAWVNATTFSSFIREKVDKLSLGGVKFMEIKTTGGDVPFTYANPEIAFGGTYAWQTGGGLVTDGAGQYSWQITE